VKEEPKVSVKIEPDDKESKKKDKTKEKMVGMIFA
jgi:hypothetical protein